jgi:hypothetical protein
MRLHSSGVSLCWKDVTTASCKRRFSYSTVVGDWPAPCADASDEPEVLPGRHVFIVAYTVSRQGDETLIVSHEHLLHPPDLLRELVLHLLRGAFCTLQGHPQ